MYELVIAAVSSIVGVLLQRYHVIPPAGPSPSPQPAPADPKSPVQPVPPPLPVPAPAQPSAHPILDSILAYVLQLISQQKAGQTLSAAQQQELRTTLPVAQQMLSEAALLVSSAPPAKP